ncbi:hypothetical protein E8E13_008876 [Curvularia kusanoi]|uniref:Uncharacterized protein n=1 Tax=Curvularia kusanoi TaxID=90978 RepID=A0A9P4TEC0_CURKU|nr:hypothetical protein E8E13_008876 [Curvularia kusanoi]
MSGKLALSAVSVSADSAPTSADQRSPFFKLPAELRNVIYEDVFRNFNLGNAFECFGGVTYVQYRPLPLLFVNRQMYKETRLLPYSLSSITAGPRTQFQGWKAKRTPDQLRAISKLHFVFDSFFFRDELPTVKMWRLASIGMTNANTIALERLFQQQLVFPEMTGLRYILFELRSHTSDLEELGQQIRILRQIKRMVENLNNSTRDLTLSTPIQVAVELHSLGENIPRSSIPSSSIAGVRMVRFDKILEGDDRGIENKPGTWYRGRYSEDELTAVWNAFVAPEQLENYC